MSIWYKYLVGQVKLDSTWVNNNSDSQLHMEGFNGLFAIFEHSLLGKQAMQSPHRWQCINAQRILREWMLELHTVVRKCFVCVWLMNVVTNEVSMLPLVFPSKTDTPWMKVGAILTRELTAMPQSSESCSKNTLWSPRGLNPPLPQLS